MKIALVVPHIFLHKEVFEHVIFAPGRLALDLAQGLHTLGHEVTLFTPGPAPIKLPNITADLDGFEQELKLRGYGYVELLKKHPLLFINLARQAQTELIAKCYSMANEGAFDIVHVYTNEEEIALAFAQLCKAPLIFTHHEPFNYSAKYRSSFYKYKNLNWLSISFSQRSQMPENTSWIGNIYHGIDEQRFTFQTPDKVQENYFLYFGRIIEPKGVHLAIEAAKQTGIKLKIAGKHYTGFNKDSYWTDVIKPQIDNDRIEYVGFARDDGAKQQLLGNAQALLVPSLWEEPFGMVMIEALACGTPIVGLSSGAIPELIEDGVNGYVIEKNFEGESLDQNTTSNALASALDKINKIDRQVCRDYFEKHFTLTRMIREHETVYEMVSSRS